MLNGVTITFQLQTEKQPFLLDAITIYNSIYRWDGAYFCTELILNPILMDRNESI